MPIQRRLSPELLEAALAGLERRLSEVDQSIVQVKRLLRSGRGPAASEPAKAARPRRKMTVAAKKRIAEAQRRRWAAFRAQASEKKTAQRAGRKIAVKKKAAPESE